MDIPKSTSYKYGKEYQLRQVQKYRNRKNNHWKIRIDLAKTLVENFSLPRLQGKSPAEMTVVDVGCSIGTFAIEFAQMGYRSFGVDFDNTALEIARQLAREENVSPQFICGDVSDFGSHFPQIDVAICFDIFEHLHDDELGAFLALLKRHLSAEGSLVFHTFPTQYDYIFYGKTLIRFPLILFKFLSPAKFNILTKIYSSVLDIGHLLLRGSTRKESIKVLGHCNPLTFERLNDILRRAGYEVLFLEASTLYESKITVQKRFQHQPITYRNLYGIAIPAISNK